MAENEAVVLLHNLQNFASFPIVALPPFVLSLDNALKDMDAAFVSASLNRRPSELDFRVLFIRLREIDTTISVKDAAKRWQNMHKGNAVADRKFEGTKAKYRFEKQNTSAEFNQ